MKLFVYGTLMHGFNLHFYLKKYPFLGRAIIKGYDLYDLEFFPAIVPGSGIVHGEVYEVDERLMDTLDSVEGVDRENPSAGLYIKEETFAFFGDYKEKVVIYVYNRDLPKDSKLIESGDYTFKKERTGKINYFAYGSDIYTRRMKERSIEILAKYGDKSYQPPAIYGEDIQIKPVIYNNSTRPEANYTVTIFINGSKILEKYGYSTKIFNMMLYSENSSKTKT